MAFTERQWSRLLTDIGDHQVVPVLGPELLVVDPTADVAGLLPQLARGLAKDLDIDTQSLPARFEIEDVAAQYFRRPDSDRDEVYASLRKLLGARNSPVPEPLKSLASITHFDVFISLTPDNLLERALNDVRRNGRGPALSLAYTTRRPPVDLPAIYKPSYDSDAELPAAPAIYQIFGELGPDRDCAILDEDILRFGHRLQSRDRQPQNLFDLMRHRQLLLLGSAFPGWLTRFFLAAAKEDHLFTEGARGWIADASSQRDSGLVWFLERRKMQVYREGDAASFACELYRRWADANRPAPVAAPTVPGAQDPAEPPAFHEDSIFLSYASEDRAIAQSIRDTLETAGLDVWFDQRRLEPGDDFRDKILSNIEHCSFFLPVISKNTTIAARRFFFLEWDKAVDEARFRPRDYCFIVPIAIDETPPGAPHLPAAFSTQQWQRLESGQVPAALLDLLKARIRDLRRQRRPA